MKYCVFGDNDCSAFAIQLLNTQMFRSTGPGSGEECSDVIAETHNIVDAASWSYGTCPDVEECRLGLHDCHHNATCINTPTAYTCQCNRGFMGDGRDSCERT